MKETTVKINKKEAFSKKAVMSYLQIAILIIGSFAFAYLVYESSKVLGEDNIEIKNKDNTKNKLMEFIIKIITKPMLPQVSAAAFLNCCPKTKLNDTCLDFSSGECPSKCSEACISTQCKDFANCMLGCCWDASQGTCAPNSPKVSCDSAGGVWKNSADCNVNQVQECRLGCCVLGENAAFVTSKRCEILAGQRNLEVDFRVGIRTEGECIALKFQDSRGACMFSDKSCKMLTNNECKSLAGRNVFLGTLCTASALDSSCKPTSNTGCVEGKDEVYFRDSCGNAANIYDSKQAGNSSYWERVISKENSCSSSSGNIGSKTCGNCLYFAGSRCRNYQDAKMDKPNLGELICADLSCEDAPYLVDALGKVLEKKDRKNGESWCVYDSQINTDDKDTMSRDTVGSRHFRYSCIDGEIKVEPCADFRNEICTEQNEFDIDGTSVKFSAAACRLNTWQSCIEVNTRKDSVTSMEQKCSGADCFVKKINVDSGFKFDICAPINKEGFDIKSEGTMKTAEQVCGLASQKCTVVYKKKTFGGCECVKNCNCLKADSFTKQMNELCASLGDCGGYVNILGTYTDEGYSTKNVGKISQTIINLYKKYASPVAGEKVDANRSLEVAGEFGFPVDSGAGGGDKKSSSTGMMLGIGAAGIGFSIGQMTVGGFSTLFAGKLFGSAPILSGTWAGGAAPGFAAFGSVMIGAGIGMIVGSLMAKLMGVTSPGIAMAMTALGGIAGAMIGYMAFTTWNPTLIVIVVVIIIVMIILGLFGKGKCPPKIVEYKCMPWQPPSGGGSCESCNSGTESGLKPCSKYRCQSLGAACEFINEGSDKELCITKVNDGRAPVISPNYNALTGNFSYTNVTSSGFSVRQSDGKCIESFAQLAFGISTDEASQCKIDLAHKTKYDAMENYFGESNLYLYNHTMGYAMPSIELIMHCANDTNLTEAEVMKQIKNTRIFTRCQDVFGNVNSNEYLIDLCARPGPDKTAPAITSTVPVSGANLAFNTTKKDIEIYTSEPASCKWSKQDKSYDAMEANFLCDSACESSLFGWKCGATITNLSLGENKFYFRCKDQPWLEGTVNASKRNANTQSYDYNLKVTETPLTITRIIPGGTITFGSELAPVDLIVDTEGGIENGKSWCYYKNGESWIAFMSDFAASFEELASTHTQEGLQLPAGDYKLAIKCTDGGNEVFGNAVFKLEQDTQAPQVTRIYNEGSNLKVETDEKSTCYYSENSNQKCNYALSEGKQLLYANATAHYMEWKTSNNLYIKCADSSGNQPNPLDCSIIVRAYNEQVSLI